MFTNPWLPHIKKCGCFFFLCLNLVLAFCKSRVFVNSTRSQDSNDCSHGGSHFFILLGSGQLSLDSCWLYWPAGTFPWYCYFTSYHSWELIPQASVFENAVINLLSNQMCLKTNNNKKKHYLQLGSIGIRTSLSVCPYFDFFMFDVWLKDT